MPRRARARQLIRTYGDCVIRTYTTPGIYQAIAPLPPDVRLVRTDIAGFFGFTERGPVVTRDPAADSAARLKAAVKLNSWNDFRNVFGGFLHDSYLAYAVRGFFGTGGTTCYVVRVGAATSPATGAVLPLPAAIPPKFLTYVAAPVTTGQSKIHLESSVVVSEGDLIAFGDADSGECLSVAEINDDQTITVQPAPESAHATGDLVFHVRGTSSKAAAAPGAISLDLANAQCFYDQDLVVIQGGGRSEVRVVIGAPSGSTLHLSRALDSAYAAGSVVRKYPAALTVIAFSQGTWGNRIRIEVTPMDAGNAVTHFSLRVSVDRGDDPGQPIQEEFYPLLSVDPSDSPAINAVKVINENSQIIQVTPPDSGSTVQPLLVGAGPLAARAAYLQGGDDGTVASNVTTQDFQAALDVLGLVDEVAILCCPDAVGPPTQAPTNVVATAPASSPPCADSSVAAPVVARAQAVAPISGGWSAAAIQQLMIAQCAALQYRVAVLDTPMSANVLSASDQTTSLQPSQVLQWVQAQPFEPQWRKFAALYYPWLRVPDELEIAGPNRTVPPCGHIAGAYAWTDNQFGVQKPPANVELNFVSDVDLAVSDQQQGLLNSAGVNAIRPFPGRGIRVWGARSISQDPLWTYIHTRRLLSMIENSVEKTSQWLVFQPNDADLRRMVTHSLSVFLQAIWLQGGLKGDRATDSYFVKCDDTNNPQVSIDSGRLVCQVGVAIAAPMEFLVFEISRSVEGSQIVEA